MCARAHISRGHPVLSCTSSIGSATHQSVVSTNVLKHHRVRFYLLVIRFALVRAHPLIVQRPGTICEAKQRGVYTCPFKDSLGRKALSILLAHFCSHLHGAPASISKRSWRLRRNPFTLENCRYLCYCGKVNEPCILNLIRWVRVLRNDSRATAKENGRAENYWIC